MSARAEQDVGKAWGQAGKLVEAVELEALGFSAQSGCFQGLLRIRADLPQPSVCF